MTLLHAGTFPDASVVVAMILLGMAAYWDVRWRRIPNWLVLAGFGASLLLCIDTGGMTSVQTSLLAGAAFGLFFGVCGVRGWLGFGDVKAIAVLGMLLGWRRTLDSVTYGFIFGAGLTLAYLVWKGKAMTLIPRLRHHTGAAKVKGPSVPLAPFLLVGTIVALLRG